MAEWLKAHAWKSVYGKPYCAVLASAPVRASYAQMFELPFERTGHALGATSARKEGGAHELLITCGLPVDAFRAP
jgi:hypothetical protein